MSSNNRIALTIESDDEGLALLREPVPHTKRQAQEVRKAETLGKYQWWIDRKLGFPPVLHWCCGASLELDYYGPGGYGAMTRSLSAFYHTHEGCLPDNFAGCPTLQTNGQMDEVK